MSKRVKGFATMFLSLMLLLINILSGIRVYAATNISVINTEPEQLIMLPGETRKLRIPVKSVGGAISSPVISVDTTNTPYTATEPTLWSDTFGSSMNYIFENLNQYIEFEVEVAEDAKIGAYKIVLFIEGSTNTGTGAESVSTKLEIKTQILKEKEPAQLTINDIKYDNLTIEKNIKDITLSFRLKNEGELIARSVNISLEYGDTGMIAGYPAKKIKIGDLEAGKETSVKLPIRILPTARGGMKSLRVNITYKDTRGASLSEDYDIYMLLIERDPEPTPTPTPTPSPTPKLKPNLKITDFKYNPDAKPNEKLGVVIELGNFGQSEAYGPRLYVDESSLGTTKLIQDFYTEYIELKDMKVGQNTKVEIPLLISKDNKGGFQTLKLNLVYFDKDGDEYSSSVTFYPYIEEIKDVKEEEPPKEEKTPIVIISNVVQSPKQPKAGGSLDISFDITNKGNMDLEEFKLGLRNLNGSTFIPINSDPYLYIGTFKIGEIKKITIPLMVSEDIPEGLNNLTLAYSYTGGGESIDIPVLDVKNERKEEETVSKPKLIVSNYGADVDEVRAGGIFNFNFEIRNTHSSVAAKNIIVTLTGKSMTGQEVFTVTQGSNSFFVNKIGPGETFTGSLELKAKSDTATNAYPINVTIEYEYDGIKPNPATGEIGEKQEYDLNLQVVENARPVVDYVNVYSWDRGVTVNNPASLSFEFYNMGKSTLNNVVATVEGDFMPSGASMYFLGNVMAGGNAYAEYEVIPIVEGTAYGTVKITYEDSNGEEQIYTKEFETFVMGEQIWTPDFPTDGGTDVFNPTTPEVKKNILPLWMFIAIQVAIFAIFTPISRKVIISIYKGKLRKKEEEMY